MKIEWIPPDHMRGFAIAEGRAVGIILEPDPDLPPAVGWRVSGKVVQPWPNTLRETALAGSEAAARAEAALMVQRLLVAWDEGAAA